jgi:hypothetical protein
MAESSDEEPWDFKLTKGKLAYLDQDEIDFKSKLKIPQASKNPPNVTSHDQVKFQNTNQFQNLKSPPNLYSHDQAKEPNPNRFQKLPAGPTQGNLSSLNSNPKPSGRVLDVNYVDKNNQLKPDPSSQSNAPLPISEKRPDNRFLELPKSGGSNKPEGNFIDKSTFPKPNPPPFGGIPVTVPKRSDQSENKEKCLGSNGPSFHPSLPAPPNKNLINGTSPLPPSLAPKSTIILNRKNENLVIGPDKFHQLPFPENPKPEVPNLDSLYQNPHITPSKGPAESGKLLKKEALVPSIIKPNEIRKIDEFQVSKSLEKLINALCPLLDMNLIINDPSMKILFENKSLGYEKPSQIALLLSNYIKCSNCSSSDQVYELKCLHLICSNCCSFKLVCNPTQTCINLYCPVCKTQVCQSDLQALSSKYNILPFYEKSSREQISKQGIACKKCKTVKFNYFYDKCIDICQECVTILMYNSECLCEFCQADFNEITECIINCQGCNSDVYVLGDFTKRLKCEHLICGKCLNSSLYQSHCICCNTFISKLEKIEIIEFLFRKCPACRQDKYRGTFTFNKCCNQHFCYDCILNNPSCPSCLEKTLDRY